MKKASCSEKQPALIVWVNECTQETENCQGLPCSLIRNLPDLPPWNLSDLSLPEHDYSWMDELLDFTELDKLLRVPG